MSFVPLVQLLAKGTTCKYSFSWGTRATTLRVTALTVKRSTAESCAPVWCRSACTQLLDRPFNDALRIVPGCLKSTPTGYLPVLSGIPPAELRRKAATLSIFRAKSYTSQLYQQTNDQ